MNRLKMFDQDQFFAYQAELHLRVGDDDARLSAICSARL